MSMPKPSIPNFIRFNSCANKTIASCVFVHVDKLTFCNNRSSETDDLNPILEEPSEFTGIDTPGNVCWNPYCNPFKIPLEIASIIISIALASLPTPFKFSYFFIE